MLGMMEGNRDDVKMMDLISKVLAMQRKDAVFVVEILVFVPPFIPFQVSAPLHTDNKETVSFHVL